MTWVDFYLVCFLVGFLLSVLSLFSGGSGPHFHLDHGSLHFHDSAHGGAAPFLNFTTLAAFLAWFGGTGYLVTAQTGLWVYFGLGIAIVGGLAGAAIVFWFLAKVLLARDRDLDPADYDMIGVLGRVSSAVRAGGTGEMVFSQQGARRAAAIRAEDGEAVAKGAEVVVTRYEKGIAYVKMYDEFEKEG